jgi:hypothetical protein
MRIQISLIVAALFMSTPVFANQDWVQVEVVVFELKHPQTDNEKWPAQPENPADVPSQSLNDRGNPDRDAFVVLPPTQFKLNKTIANMESSGEYKMLYHTAWRQPLNNNSPSVRIEKNNELLGTVTLNNLHQPNINADLILHRSAESAVTDPAEMMDPALKNQNSIIEASNQMDNTIQYRLKQSQHFKTGDLTYFDHPAFGMLVDVQPYQPKVGLKTGSR